MQIEFLYQEYLKSGKVSTDTRSITPGSVFFALKGPNFNANTFAKEALSRGASLAVVDDPSVAEDERFVLVDDVLDTLQKLATFHRSKLDIPFIGLTGSNGKTTSKELVSAVLSKKYKTLATKGNLNNHIGVPLTILSIEKAIEIAVIEMGANHVGEIAALCKIARPTHGFITNIGKAHIGTFGGFDNIIRAKSELYQYLIQHNGTVWINSQDPILSNMAKRFKSPLMYPATGDYYHCEMVDANPLLRLKAENGEAISTNLFGGYNFHNVAVALCIGKYFDVEARAANQAVTEYAPENMRSQIITKNSNTIILDAYNANPSSMEAAIRNIAQVSDHQKVLILGDMFELGEEAEAEHRNLAKLIQTLGFKYIYLVGNLMAGVLSELPEARHFESKEALVKELRRHPIKDATILIKASRGIGLETIFEDL